MPLFRRGADAASTLDLLVAGLGNPGREYAGTRHNVGWMVVDELARRHGGSWRSKFSGQLAEIRLDSARLALLKPETYMNESGRSVGAAARFFKVPADTLLVMHDDVDLEPGRLQARLGGGLAGHNGLRSIAAAARFFKTPVESVLVAHDDVDLEEGRLQARLGGGLAGHNGLRSIARDLGSQEFLRLRIGVGRPGRGDRRSVADFVLAPFAPETDVEALVARAADAVETLLRDGLDAAQQRFN